MTRRAVVPWILRCAQDDMRAEIIAYLEPQDMLEA